MNRRTLMISAAALLALPRVARAETFEVTLTEEEWRKKLTGMQYYVLREEGTEDAGSHPYDKEYRAGTYHCAGCDLAAFSSQAKYDSGTGWPSFWNPCPMPSAPRTTPGCSAAGPRSIAAAAAGTLAMSSTMDPPRRASATA